MKLYLGIDTSAYTTSLAVVDEEGNILNDERMLLNVPQGGRGLRQSEAVFQHIKNLPLLFARIKGISSHLEAIAVSDRPRPAEESYMPVFKAGETGGRILSLAGNIPLYPVSHQEGHIMAGIWNNPVLLEKEEFLAVHFSGGTSEILYVKRGKTSFFAIEECLKGLDIHAGQLIDRVGVAMGLPFPAGKEMEKLLLAAGKNETALTIPSFVSRQGFSFSGAETMALKLLKKGYSREDVAFALLRVIANTLEKALLMIGEERGVKDVLLVGGVMANIFIKERLIKRLMPKGVGFKLYFAYPHLSTDNAVGVALLARAWHKK
ncbi:N6-L-threonylcarbamoyladenine synthase [Thermosyntropha lipolytica DSM 11003]|uniref:N(6)-L-threonylcarbamoyladenine synthase n=1 Tax=Thermosyntropha lipolytica DSM 11003 TaxID=1123382 RepID=A0A1M5LIU0_9FIRM|nr:peptidase M22 [Thermosyntropha lipolytica]SHG64961.1 N6-L-threonylcarbamoyladenine synthase [Thermosyntropha lipolytica DSM 11003]